MEMASRIGTANDGHKMPEFGRVLNDELRLGSGVDQSGEQVKGFDDDGALGGPMKNRAANVLEEKFQYDGSQGRLGGKDTGEEKDE